MLTQERLKELLDYDPDTGIFLWKVSRYSECIGKEAGSVAITDGYRRIALDGKKYLAHRLAWLFVYGVWPTNQIDHIDHNKSRNKISNLRDVTNGENQQNQIKPQKHNHAGKLGVRHRNGKYQAQIKIDGKSKHLGSYSTADEAHLAYLQAKRKHHSGCTI